MTSGDVLDVGDVRRLGVRGDEAVLRFGEAEHPPPSWRGPRWLTLDGDPAYELSFWCGTCAFLFSRQQGANRTLGLDQLRDRLAAGVDRVEDDVVSAYGDLLEEGRYLPLLVRVRPTLVLPSDSNDYFAHEQVATWGVEAFTGLPQYPATPYYRTFETAVDAETHLYEFVVPMVPPRWNDRETVETYADRLVAGHTPAAVAVSVLDICQPAVLDPDATDYYEHWCLTHFLLDGHHKLEAAARTGSSVDLLVLLATDAGLASPDDVRRMVEVRSRAFARRPAAAVR